MSRAATVLISDCGGCGEKDGGRGLGGGGIMCNARKRQMESVSRSVTCDWSSQFNKTHNFAKELGSTRFFGCCSFDLFIYFF